MSSYYLLEGKSSDAQWSSAGGLIRKCSSFMQLFIKNKKVIKISYFYVFRLRVLALRLPVGSDRQGKGKEPTWSDASYLLL